MTTPSELSWFDVIRIQLWLRRLERPVVARERVPLALFVGSLMVYWLVGQIYQQFHAHDVDNLMFGGDVSRVWHDLARSDRESTSGIAVSSAHPLFVWFFHPVTSVVSRALGGADLMAALLVCHSAAALGNSLLYVLLRRLGLERNWALGITLVLVVSTAQLVFGSTTETYSFIPAATLGLAWLALRVSSVALVAPVALLPFAANLTLLPYSLLCAPVIWLGRMRLRRWLPTILGFWVLLVGLGLLALLHQHVQYPETNFFQPSSFGGYYNVYVNKPVLADRLRELIPNFLGFSVVGPRPIIQWASTQQAGFAYRHLSTYSGLGWLVAGLWIGCWLLGTYANVVTFLRMSRQRQAFLLLCGGWLLGSFGFFMYYGVEMFLPSEFWTAHLVLWVGLGLDALLLRHPGSRRGLAAVGVVGLALLMLNQSQFVVALVRNYYSGPLLTLPLG